jgi:hypothetical protein
MRNLVQVMGPGCGNRDVEHCPPTYHFELNSDELMGVIADPSAIARELGVEVKAVHVASSKDAGNEAARTVYCCVNCLTDSLCCQAWPTGSVPETQPA